MLAIGAALAWPHLPRGAISAIGALGWMAAGTPVGARAAPGSTAVITPGTSTGGTGGLTANASIVTGLAGGADESTGGA